MSLVQLHRTHLLSLPYRYARASQPVTRGNPESIRAGLIKGQDAGFDDQSQGVPLRLLGEIGETEIAIHEAKLSNGHGNPFVGDMPCPIVQSRGGPYSERIRISTRRFSNLPFSVELSAIGLDFPYPLVLILGPSATPCFRRYSFTAAALLSERRWLYFSLPMLSVCPSMEIL